MGVFLEAIIQTPPPVQIQIKLAATRTLTNSLNHINNNNSNSRASRRPRSCCLRKATMAQSITTRSMLRWSFPTSRRRNLSRAATFICGRRIYSQLLHKIQQANNNKIKILVIQIYNYLEMVDRFIDYMLITVYKYLK